jgi:hypothetical protein
LIFDVDVSSPPRQSKGTILDLLRTGHKRTTVGRLVRYALYAYSFSPSED